MKALNLKSMSWIMALAMMFIVSFTGCSDDDGEDGGPIAPVFPELKETNCGANETTEISFEANLDWEISSNAGWCKFINGEISESIMSGKAGKQTIKIAVSADGQNYNDDAIAEITLKMGEKSQVIYKIKRAKKEYSDLVITDEEGNVYDAEHPLTIKGNNISIPIYTSLKAQAEDGMEIGFTNPEWLTYRINEETGMYEFTFNTDNEEGLNIKYPIAQGNGVLVFATADAETAKTDKIRKVEIPLIYEGVQADAIGISPTHMNVIVKPDGQSIISGETTSNELVSTIIARNDEFHIIEFVQTYNSAEGAYTYDFSDDGDVDWVQSVIGTGENKDKITLTVGSNEGTDERAAIVMVFPKAVYETIKNDLSGNIIDNNTGDIKTMYNTNIMVTLKQEKIQQQAERITFKAELYGNSQYLNSMEEGSKNDITDLKNSPNVEDYHVENNNVWKITIPQMAAYMYSQFTEFGETTTTALLIEAVGMATGQEITEKTSHSNAHGLSLTGNFYDLEMGELVSRSGWGIYFDDPSTYDNNYQLVVKGEDGKTLALCIIEIAAE